MNVLKVDYTDPEAALKLDQSLRETGFAVLVNHRIDPGLLAAAYADWAVFFASEKKYRYTFDPKDQSGFFPFKTEHAKDSSIKDLKEFFHMFPDTDLPVGMSNATKKLAKALMGLGEEILIALDNVLPKKISDKLDEPLVSMIQRSEGTLFRILHYPPLNGSEETGAVRAFAHEDINLITLLPAATASGLQVRDMNGNWVDVPVDPGSIVINAGDMLKEATDGYYPSTTHRVMNPVGEEAILSRYSMPMFIHPRPGVVLSERYTAGQYLTERLAEIGLLK